MPRIEPEVREIFPPLETALELEPEELAPFVLKYLNALAEANTPIQKKDLVALNGPKLQEYAGERQEELGKALAEAWAWLVGATFIGEKTGVFDARSAELAALREAVRHARDRAETHEPGCPDLEGLRAYDRWVEKFQKSDSRWDNGDSYCYYIYRTTHRAAGDFLREIAPGYGQAKKTLLTAADSFKAEADALDSAERLLKADPPLADAQRNAGLWPMLAQARDYYAAAITQIEKALSIIE